MSLLSSPPCPAAPYLTAGAAEPVFPPRGEEKRDMKKKEMVILKRPLSLCSFSHSVACCGFLNDGSYSESSNTCLHPRAQEVHQQLCLGIAYVRQVTVALSEK